MKNDCAWLRSETGNFILETSDQRLSQIKMYYMYQAKKQRLLHIGQCHFVRTTTMSSIVRSVAYFVVLSTKTFAISARLIHLYVLV